MRAAILSTSLWVATLAGIACSSPAATPPAPKLQPAETFNWAGQTISISMPPEGWRREGENGGGIKGVRFVKERSVGEGIGIGEFHAVAEESRGELVTLGQVIDRVEFKPEKKQNPEYYKLIGRRETACAGEPAVVIDYTVKVPERPQTYSAREVYFMHNSHMFVCTFIGLPETLPVFEAMLASVAFPK